MNQTFTADVTIDPARNVTTGLSSMPTEAMGTTGSVTPPEGTTMLQLQAWLTTSIAAVRDRLVDAEERRSEKGATTLEYVLIAAAVFALAGIVVAAISAVINREAGEIK